MQLVLKFRNVLPNLVVEELDSIVATIRAFFGREHREDGTHGAIHADSVTTGEVTADSISADGIAAGAITASSLAVTGEVTVGRTVVSKQPAARARIGGAGQSMAHAAFTTITWTLTDYDIVPGIRQADLQAVYATIAGVYLVTVNISWPGATQAGQRHLELSHNNDSIPATVAQMQVGTGVTLGQSVSTVLSMDVGDFLKVRVYQDSGGPLMLAATSHITMTYLGSK